MNGSWRKTLRNILHGMGSVLDIWPAPLPPLKLKRFHEGKSDWQVLCEDGDRVWGRLRLEDPPK